MFAFVGPRSSATHPEPSGLRTSPPPSRMLAPKAGYHEKSLNPRNRLITRCRITGTPGTVGGAVYGNAHFQGRLISELVTGVTLVTPAGEVQEVAAADMEFAYDYSRLHRTREVVMFADFRVGTGEPAALREVARQSLAFRKRTQPLEAASAGCVFQNPDPARDAVPDGIPPSAGALVDRAGLKGASEGQARVSPTHANFIVNEGGATAREIGRLVDRCKRAVAERFGVHLREEIVRLGFED